MIGWYPENRSAGPSPTYAARQTTAPPRLGAGAGESIAAAARAGAATGPAGNHDFSNMTPAEMGDVADKLFRAGEIDLTQLFMLENLGVPLGRANEAGQFVPFSKEERDSYRSQPFDYFAGTRDAMAFIEQSGRTNDPKSGYRSWQGILETLQRRQGTPAGLDVAV